MTDNCGIHTQLISTEQITADLMWYSHLVIFFKIGLSADY